jgi:hypothetical protein
VLVGEMMFATTNAPTPSGGSKRKICQMCLYRCPADFSYEKKHDEISRTLRLMHGGRSFDQILPEQVGYFRARMNWNQPIRPQRSQRHATV